MAGLAPETAIERQYAQTFCDTQWRLNRARSYEDNMLAIAHFEAATVPDVDHPGIEAALTAAKIFRESSKAFVNLSLYEQRLARQRKEALRQLQELQMQRKAATLAEANANKTKPESARNTQDNPDRQFVFSTPEIERELGRQATRAEDQNRRSSAEFPCGEAA